MAPTIQNTGVNIQQKNKCQKTQQTTPKSSELIWKVKYSNTLPELPFDLKFIRHPFSATRFVKYKQTTLEQKYKFDHLTEPDVGVEVDLVNQAPFKPNLNAVLDAADEKLLEEDGLTPQDTVRSKFHAKSVSWLRRTEYISTEQTRFQPQSVEKVEARVGFNIKQSLMEGIVYMDRPRQLEAIKKTFEDNKKPIERHYSKPSVVPVEILPVFPDFQLWRYPSAQVIFDTDPAPVGVPVAAQIEEMSLAMIRGVKDESGEQFVAYFLPTQETLEKRRRDTKAGIDYVPDEEYEYKLSREYNWNVRNKLTKGYEENFYFVVRKDGIYYNELETRVRLCKRRQNINQVVNNTHLIVKHRALTSTELKTHKIREKQLEPLGYDDDDCSEQEEETQIQLESEQNKNTGKSESNVEETTRSLSVESRRQSRSRSRTKSKSKSKSRSRSKSKSRSRSRSRTRSKSRSKSKSRSRSRSRTRSKSRSKSKSRSRSRSRTRSKSRSKSKSRSRSRSRTRSKSRSKSKSRSRSRSRSRSKSRSKSKSQSRSRSTSKSRSRSRSKSASGSRSRSLSSSSRSKSSSSRSSSIESHIKSRKSKSRSRSSSRSRCASPASCVQNKDHSVS